MPRISLRLSLLLAAGFGLAAISPAQAPSTTLSNGKLTAKIYLPDAKKGYYRGTRFDWSGIVSSLKFQGHEFITPWSEGPDPSVGDYEYRGEKIVTGPCTTMVGIPEEFASLPAKTAFGFEDAKPGQNFVKIGVGVLRKPDDKPYDHYRLYEIVSGNQWTVKKAGNSISFTQTVNDPASGYGYVYTKKLTLVPGTSTLTLEHTLKNTGSKAIVGQGYDHNFQRWDGQGPGPDYSVKLIYDPKPVQATASEVLQLNGRTVNFARALTGKESMRMQTTGFENNPGAYDFRIENSKMGIGLRIAGDHAMLQTPIWGIRSVFAIEPFVAIEAQPGQSFQWKYTYEAYALAATK